MSIRAVTAALAVWCVSGAAMAAGYTETWNPPEASRHAAKPAKKNGAVAKFKAGSRVDAKAGSKHAVSAAGHKAPRVASAGGSAAGTAAHGGAKKVAAKGKGCAKVSAACKSGTKAVVTAQAKKPHASLAQRQAKSHQDKIVHANMVQSGAARAHSVKIAAKPAASHMNAPAASANVSGAAPDTATNPATASSGSLPPILR
ncbi:hypothetical protein LMG27177_06419 [Paraburkholderia fynbosensis]|uniref:Acid shock protein n=1 Tax=Paraburkholderia fynbosensis TaxID=1200993 RepID=A0A6J5GVP3_9BURK|nr:hypothetical protein [Paraburkholderia fynbosensis]CAB3807820.1 hypothetical protein LMG27177_06419 [Paraburkholderia fynbosensis]